LCRGFLRVSSDVNDDKDPVEDLSKRRLRYVLMAVAGGIILLVLVSLLPG
jgi:hypothetical protein